MLQIGICDDGKEVCAELENILYEYGRKHGIRTEVTEFIWLNNELP